MNKSVTLLDSWPHRHTALIDFYLKQVNTYAGVHQNPFILRLGIILLSILYNFVNYTYIAGI